MIKNKLIAVLVSWVGIREPNHAFIIDKYNNFFDIHGHRPRGYRVTYKDAWCATGLSSAIIEAGGGFDYPLECGCQEMIKLYEDRGEYFDAGSFEPQSGDIIFYDWQGDGHSDHVGLVEAVDGQILTVIECNNNDAVARRTIGVDSPYIKGYARPKYESEEKPSQPDVVIPELHYEDGEAVYRLYNSTGEEHFYTKSRDEANALALAGWVYEGIAFIAPKSGLEAERMVAGDGRHAYVTTEQEYDALLAAGYVLEGAAFYTIDASTLPNIPVYRVYNPNSGDHVFTIKVTEYEALCDIGWIGEGIRFYAVR